jgi:hypothetical protein
VVTVFIDPILNTPLESPPPLNDTIEFCVGGLKVLKLLPESPPENDLKTTLPPDEGAISFLQDLLAPL